MKISLRGRPDSLIARPTDSSSPIVVVSINSYFSGASYWELTVYRCLFVDGAYPMHYSFVTKENLSTLTVSICRYPSSNAFFTIWTTWSPSPGRPIQHLNVATQAIEIKYSFRFWLSRTLYRWLASHYQSSMWRKAHLSPYFGRLLG